MRNFFYSLVILLAAFSAQQVKADLVVFDFVNSTLNDELAGATQTATSETSGTVVTLTTTSVTAPDLSMGLPAGANLAAETNLASAATTGFLGVNNLSVTNDAFTDLTGVTAGTESTDFNDGEEITITLDSDATFAFVDYVNFSGTELATITIGASSLTFGETNPEDCLLYTSPSPRDRG